jgi:hypothetical protein
MIFFDETNEPSQLEEEVLVADCHSLKNISINGTKNRYMMKKVMKDETTVATKKNTKNLNEYTQNLYILDDNSYQLKIINYIIERNDDNYVKERCNENDIKTLFLEETACKKTIIQEINKKINSYKQQDIKRNIFNEYEFITTIQIIQKLSSCNLKCFYCECSLFVIYDIIREMKQWTLDRINNELGHTNENTIISCLKCNLKRRNINKDAFDKSSKIKGVVKLS